jgi:hypothetical protein
MRTFMLFFCSLLLAILSQGQIIHVPADYSTIQLGINAATPGDTVLVAEGNYYEQINFLGKKPLIVASQFLMDGDTSHIANTIIDGSQIPTPATASVVYFISGEDTTSILCGFTIQGGKGTNSPLWGTTFSCGGGVYIKDSGASFRYNIIQDNEVNDTLSSITDGACGGGIYAFNGFPGWVIIKNNRIVNNRAITNHHVAEGGGIHVYLTNARITENKILNNLTRHTTMDGWCAGGGLICMGDDFPSIQAAICDNEISTNQALGPGGSYGGGASFLHLDNSSYIRNNVISGNKANWFGGGLDFFSYNLTTFNVESNYFFNNEAFDGGAIDDNYDSTSRILLTNNIFVHNTAYDQGGAIWTYRISGSTEDHLLISVNNSFYDNHAANAGGAVYAYEDNPLIFNSIFWQNPGLDNNAITAENGTTEIAFSDLDSNLIAGFKIIGAGMINADPMFSDTDLLMTAPWSPCVEFGVAEYTCTHGILYLSPDKDILGNLRPVGSGYDMGAYDIEGWGLGTGQIANYELRITNSPNPVYNLTTFAYTLREPEVVTIQVYDSFGQNIALPVNSFQQKGDQKVEWNPGNLPAGIYFYRIKAGKLNGSGKMILTK